MSRISWPQNVWCRVDFLWWITWIVLIQMTFLRWRHFRRLPMTNKPSCSRSVPVFICRIFSRSGRLARETSRSPVLWRKLRMITKSQLNHWFKSKCRRWHVCCYHNWTIQVLWSAVMRYPEGDRLQPVLMKEKGKAHAGIIKVIGLDGK